MRGGIFHAHLDVCAQCRDHPFALCATGAQLLRREAEAFTQHPPFSRTPEALPRRRAEP